MAWLLSTYTIRLNHRHKLFGHVFSGRYKALIVDGDGSGYLRTVCDYVHLNPVRAGFIAAADRLLAYPWSSLGWYLAAPKHRPNWLRVDRLLGERGIGQDTAAGRREFEVRMEARRAEAVDEQALQSQLNNLVNAIRDLHGGGFIPVFNLARRIKRPSVGAGFQWTFRQCMVGLRPQVIIRPVTIPAARRSGISGKFISEGLRSQATHVTRKTRRHHQQPPPEIQPC